MKIDNSFSIREKQVPNEFRIEEPIHLRAYLSGGELLPFEGEVKEVFSPVIIKENNDQPKLLGSYPMMTGEQAKSVLQEAVQAYDLGRGHWPTLSVRDRIEYIEKFVERMKEKREQVVNLLMWEIGKNLIDSRKEFDRTVQYIIDTMDALKELDRRSSSFYDKEGIIAQIRRAPLGVTYCMGPYNYPLNETFTTLIPALIMGNTVVFKPAKYGVLLIEPLMEVFKECFPKGVINIIFGSGRVVGTALMSTGQIDIFAFIGGSGSASALKKHHPKPHRLRSVLGLDAKNPAILLADTNVDEAVKETQLGALSFNGQRCTAIKIVFVHESIVDEYLEKLTAKVEAMKIGAPWDEGVEITPLPEPHKIDYLNELIEDAKSKGAKVYNKDGGKAVGQACVPAIVYPTKATMRLYDEEQFGPIIPIISFKDISEPIQYIVTSNFGQQVSIFGNNEEVIAKLIDPLVNQVCRVNINSQCQRGPDVFPFNGRKDSAEGTLSVHDALRVFSIRSLVAAKKTDDNKRIIGNIIKDNRSNFLSTDYIF